MHHEGNLIITKEDAEDFQDLISVDGVLEIHAEASLPNLINVGGSLFIYADASLPNLTIVGHSLFIEADVSLPALTSVGGATLPDPAVAHERLLAVARQVVEHPETLYMSGWHCVTSHCVGGWAVEQAGELGRMLVNQHGDQVSATLLLGVEGAKLFYLSDEQAMARLKEILQHEEKSTFRVS